MAVTKQQLAQWSREFAAKNPDKVSGAGSTAQSTTTKKSSVTKEQLSQWSRELTKGSTTSGRTGAEHPGQSLTAVHRTAHKRHGGGG